MKKIFLVLILLLFVAGCTGFNKTDYEQGENIPTACPPDCFEGYEGITTEVLTPFEGTTIYAKERLYPVIYLEDKGQADGAGVVCLTGLDEDVFDNYYSCTCNQEFDITINDASSPYFEEMKLEPESTYANPEESVDQTLSVVTRYTYTTFGTIDICLTGDPGDDPDCNGYITEGDKEYNILSSSSSGPLTITKVTETLSKVGGDAVTMRLTIEASINDDSTVQLIEEDDIYSDSCSTLPDSRGVSADVFLALDNVAYDCNPLVFEVGESEASTTCKVENIPTSNLVGGTASKIRPDNWIEVNYAWEQRQSVSFKVEVEESFV
jgi:hypothetical protein